MKIALISDALTSHALQLESHIKQVTPWNYKYVLKLWKPHILLVESAWQGHNNWWKYKIASYNEHPKRTNLTLQKVVLYAKERGVPTVFWNKEDHIHFDRFIESAKLFDHIFTVDENSIPHYKNSVEPDTTVHSLMFAIQPKLHNFTGFHFTHNRANFVGSYSHHIHAKRRMWQNTMFQSAIKSHLAVTIFDRNSHRKSENYRYPTLPNMHINPAIPYPKTAQIYKAYTISLNVNTIEDSASMFSRRLIEILACGGIAVSNPTLSINQLFPDYCHTVSNEAEMNELFYRISKFGLSSKDKERARAGASYVAAHHTWSHRIEQILNVLPNF
jgi:hypothetical protein